MAQTGLHFRSSALARVQPSAAQLWWLRPAPLILLVIVPLYLSFMAFDYENVVPRRYLPNANYFWGLALLFALALGAAVGASRGGGEGSAEIFAAPARPDIQIPGWVTAALLGFTLLAYTVWFGSLLFEFDAVLDVFRGERANLRGIIQTVPGVTTLTQCGVAYVVLVTIKRFSVGGATLSERAGVWLVFVLAIARAFLWAERLAVLEVLVPLVVTTAAFYRFRTPTAGRLAALLPFVGPVLLFLAFAGTEYFRSWKFYQDYYDSIWQFSYERLMTYYAVASNSGIGLLEEAQDWPHYTGRFVFEWAYTMPKLGRLLIDAFGDTRQDFSRFLLDYGDMEFNNPSGLFPIVYDVGYFGSAVYFFLAGLLVGIARHSYARKQPFGLMFYPFCVLFILELLRFNYLAASRFIPIAGSLLGVLFLIYELPRRRQPRPMPAWRSNMTMDVLSGRTTAVPNFGALIAYGRRLAVELAHRSWRQAPVSLARRLLRPLPDRFYLALGHLCYFGTWPNYTEPHTFNEHIHEYMLRCRDPLLRVAADKVVSREYIAERVGASYLVPLLGVWDSADAVPLDSLPRPCVLKPSAASGLVLMLWPGDDRHADDLRRILRGWLRRDYSRLHREWCYTGLPRRIVAETMLVDESGEAVPADYKAYVIGGAVRFIQVDRGRFAHHTRNIYGPDWETLPARWTLEKHAPDPAPARLHEMIEVAEKMARPFEFLRVDFYVVGDSLYIGELTNYPGAGFEKFIPGAYASVIGAYWNRPGD